MKKLIKTVAFILLCVTSIVIIWYIKKPAIPLIFSQTNVLPTLYTLTGTEDVTVTPLKGGLSAELYKIDSKDKSYVVRFTNHRLMADRLREVTVQTIASQEGWGPHLYAADSNEGWIIMEYIKPTLLTDADRLNDEMYVGLAQRLQQVHNGPQFPKGKLILQETEELLHKLHQEDKIPQSIDYAVLENILADIKKKYPTKLVPSHRELHPKNVIFSDHQIFFIDFENSAQDDPFYDLGNVGVFHIFDSYHEQLFLKIYFGHIPTQEEYAYYQQMKQLALLFCAFNLLNFVPREIIKNSLVETESFINTLQGVEQGTVNIAEPTGQLRLAISLLQEALKLQR